MIEQNLLLARHAPGNDDVHRTAYRVFCILAGLLNPLFGIVYGFTDPDAIDPLWARFSLAMPALFLVSLSYMNRWVHDRFMGLVHGYFYLLIVYIVGLSALNGLRPNYTLGIMFTITAVGVAFSLGARRRIGPLRHYLAFAVLLTIPAGLVAEAPQVSLIILWISAGSTAFVLYVAARAKIAAEASMAESEQRYHTLMSAASDAILIADPDTGLLVDANLKAQKLLGRSLDEVRRTRLSELFPEPTRARDVASLEAHVFEGQVLTEDLFVEHRNGESVPVDVSASLVEVGGRRYIQGIFRRHRYEQQLVEAKERAEELLQLKTSLLNNMSHELRTPLACILGYAEMLGEIDVSRLEERTEVAECAEVIEQSAKRLHDTLNAILGLAELDSGSPEMHHAPMDVALHVPQYVALLKPLATQKGIDLLTTAAAPSAFTLADEVVLSRIVNNLVGNAIKFTDEGHVWVEVSADDDAVYVRVQDTGIGISEDFMPHLFHEFRQESTGLARSHEGNGLGLAITKRLVHLLGGDIAVESAKGKGSTFTVTLPRVEAPEPAPASAPPPTPAAPARPAPSGLSQRCVLVVEDNEQARRLIVERLRVLCRVEAVADPEEALARAAATPFDGFFLDINLGTPRDGVALMQALRAHARYLRTPMVALTAYAMPGDRERFLEAGFDYYLNKPFTKTQLREVAARVLEAPPTAAAGDGASLDSHRLDLARGV